MGMRFMQYGKVIFIKNDISRSCYVMRMKVINEITFCMWFETKKYARMGTRVEFLAMILKGTYVT